MWNEMKPNKMITCNHNCKKRLFCQTCRLHVHETIEMNACVIGWLLVPNTSYDLGNNSVTSSNCTLGLNSYIQAVDVHTYYHQYVNASWAEEQLGIGYHRLIIDIVSECFFLVQERESCTETLIPDQYLTKLFYHLFCKLMDTCDVKFYWLKQDSFILENFRKRFLSTYP